MHLLSQEILKRTFDYDVHTGRLTRVARGRGAKTGKQIGAVCRKSGYRRAYFAGRNRPTAHLVWVYHKGALPSGIIGRANRVRDDDRIENLFVLKKPLNIEYPYQGEIISQYGRISGVIPGVYEIICTLNGRRYVGSATDIDKRWRTHFAQLSMGKHHSIHLQRAWLKHGEGSFIFKVLEFCDREHAVALEQYYIDTLKPAFNCSPVAGSQLGFKFSAESKQKMSAAAKRTKNFSGKFHSEESKKKISLSRKGKGGGYRSPERLHKTAVAMRAAKSVLNEEKVRQIRKLKYAGFRHAHVAREIGCSYSAVADVVRGRCWGWVD